MLDWLFRLFRRRRGIHVDIASISECGLVRKENQDHIFIGRRGLVFCVADGMGGGESGGTASEIICREMAESVRHRTDFRGRVRHVEEAIRRANAKVRDYAARHGLSQMGSTATVAVVDAEKGRHVAVGNIGDSRIYRMRRGEFLQLTNDHTVEHELQLKNFMLAGRGLVDMRRTALSHVLTRAVGVGDVTGLEWFDIDLMAGDILLLCSDGVHGFVKPSALKSAVAAGGRSEDIVRRVRKLVLAGGAGDNFSAIVVKIGEAT